MSADLFADMPFNLAGESQSSELTSEGQARAKAQAESEARKAQYLLDIETLATISIEPHAMSGETDAQREARERALDYEAENSVHITPTAAWIETPSACFLVGKV